MEFKDYYKILGVDRGVDQKAISATYRKLARQHHPDVNKAKGAEDTFKEINEAYQVLGDPDKRTKYDQMYEAYRRGGMDWQQIFGRRPGGVYSQAPGGWTVTYGNPEDLEDLLGGLGFSDFFKQFFGQDFVRRRGGGRNRSAAGAEPGRGDAPQAESAIEITLEDAYHGAHKSLAVQLNGTTRRIDVTIPQGVRDGQKIRLPGALDGTDLYLIVKIQPHARFERRDDDLVVELPVTLTEAMLGAKIEVPTVDGTVEMTIPAETQNGQVFRLRGQGMFKRGGGRGDELVRVKVALPTKLGVRERELFEELARLRKENPRR